MILIRNNHAVASERCQIRALKAQLNKGDKPWRDEAGDPIPVDRAKYLKQWIPNV